MPGAYGREVGIIHHRFLSDLHGILENTKANTADYDSAVTDLAYTMFMFDDYEDDLAYIEHLLKSLLAAFMAGAICLTVEIYKLLQLD